MSADIKKEIKLEIGHVLFIDIVGYSKLSINEQSAAVAELNQIVRASEQFQKGETNERLLKIPTGDGMALVFYASPEAPAQCATEISRALQEHPRVQLRMGIHSGPVSGVVDVNQRANLAGSGINIAQRAMDCGDAGHILVSKHVAEDLSEYDRWRTLLHELGPCEVKHGVRIDIVNLYGDNFGNSDVPQKFERLRKSHTKSRWTSAAIAVAALIAIAAGFFFVSKRSTSRLPEQSIAVLPFENLSRDPDNAYFAVGIQDEILTRLAKIASLKVISHTSTQQYTARPANLADIARQLGVANILEGSVQRAGDQVHINAQLIRAATDEHLWAESYDRKLENIFGVEAEVATAVADALKAKLSGSEHQALEQRPTRNPEAYNAYLRGLAYSSRPGWNEPDNVGAIKAFEEAVRLDPEFALGWAWLARELALGYFNYLGANPNQLREEARQAAKRAAALQPQLGEAFLAHGYVEYYCDANYDAAIASFETAGRLLPSSSEVSDALGLVYRRKGEWQRSNEYFQQALELSPADTMLLNEQAGSFEAFRNYPQALKTLDRLLEILPNNAAALAYKITIYQHQGNLMSAARALAALHVDANSPRIIIQAQIAQWIYERHYSSAIALLKAVLDKSDTDTDWEKVDDQASLAMLQQLSDDGAAAQRNWEEVRAKIEEERPHKGQDFLPHQLASAYVALGDKTKAFSIIREAAEAFVRKRSHDAMSAAWIPDMTARIAAQAEEKDLALEQLVTAVNAAYGPSYGDLKFSPDWDPLRGDPRFEKIVASQAPKEPSN